MHLQDQRVCMCRTQSNGIVMGWGIEPFVSRPDIRLWCLCTVPAIARISFRYWNVWLRFWQSCYLIWPQVIGNGEES